MEPGHTGTCEPPQSSLDDEKLVLFHALSPYKIPLLALIEGYCSRGFPVKIVPPMMSYFVNLVIGDPGYHKSSLSTSENFMQEIHEQQNTSAITKSSISQNETLFPSLSQLLETLSSKVMEYDQYKTCPRSKEDVEADLKSVRDYLLISVWSLSSLDQFHGYLTVSPRALFRTPKQPKDSKINFKKKYLSPNSFLGKFVGQMIQSFDSFSFDDTVMLWKAFVNYREETRELWYEIREYYKTSPGLLSARSHATSVIDIMEWEDQQDLDDKQIQNKILASSGKELDLKNESHIQIISQVDLTQLLEYHVQMLQKYAASAPKSLDRVLKLMSESQRGVIPAAYYIEYLQCWKENNYEGSFNALHRYFDYMMSNKQQLFYHYALLSLATLHASFGSDEEALRAIDEAILVARENKDLDCLNYLLTWLFNFLKNKPELYDGAVKASNNVTPRDQILQFLKVRTKENRNWLLQSTSFQFQASQFLIDGAPLNKVVENITRASYVLINFEVNPESLSSMVKNCHLSSICWSRVGLPALADLYIRIAEDICSFDISLFDKITVTIRKADLLYLKGNVDEAFEIMETCESLVSNDMALFKIWQTRFLLLKLDSWMKKCRYRSSSIILNQLIKQMDIVEDKDMFYEVKYQECAYNLKIGNQSRALQLASEVMDSLKKNEHVYNHLWYIEFQIMYANILVQSSSSPERAFSIILGAIKLSQRSSSVRYVMKATLTLVEMLLIIDPDSKKSANDCESILYKIIPVILQIDDVILKSKAYYLLAKVLSLTVSDLPQPEVNQRLNEILEHLEISIVGFRQMHDLQMLVNAFDIEMVIGESSYNVDLVNHAKSAKQQLINRIHEESSYGLY